MRKGLTEIVFILDRSGSMRGQEENTISSFNEYLAKEKKNKYKTNITTVLFSDNYSILHDREAAGGRGRGIYLNSSFRR